MYTFFTYISTSFLITFFNIKNQQENKISSLINKISSLTNESSILTNKISILTNKLSNLKNEKEKLEYSAKEYKLFYLEFQNQKETEKQEELKKLNKQGIQKIGVKPEKTFLKQHSVNESVDMENSSSII